MHGGSRGSGGPRGAANGNYRTGNFTKEAIQERRQRAQEGREAMARVMALKALARSLGMIRG